MISTEELLKPRYKVIADYPHNVVPVGEILFIRPHQENVDVNLWMSKYDEFPHLFKKLEWWEERAIEDLPEYVKYKDDTVFKPFILNGHDDTFGIIGRSGWFFRKECTPSSKEEYEQYLSQQTNK